MELFIGVLFSLLFISVGCLSDDQRKDAAEKSANTVIDMYTALRNILSPKSPLSINEVTSNRFILLSPGKILDYDSYTPGFDYENNYSRENDSLPEPVIPPSVMEKWFDIADVMVGADPFSGGVTSKSLARSYETVVSQMQVLGLETKTADAKAKYNKALAYLNSVVTDPENLAQNATRLMLYTRYQDEYADKRLEMEEKINDAHTTRGSLEYELWFQRFYPSMKSKVEGAYMKWLTFGQKDLVELYKAYVDSSTSGVEIEEARMSLRGSGVTSLDRTRTVYPVSFEPANWYNYLKTKQRYPSYDMLLTKISLLKSARNALIDVNSSVSSNRIPAKSLNSSMLDNTANTRSNKTKSATDLMIQCIAQNLNSSTSSSCDEFNQTKDDAVAAMFNEAQAMTDYERAKFFLSSNNFNRLIEKRMENLEAELNETEELLANSSPYLGGLVESKAFESLSNSLDDDADNPWLSFDYDSSQIHSDYSDVKRSFSVNISAGAIIPVQGVPLQLKLSTGFSFASEDMKQALNNADLKVSAKVIRVVIKRPWFRVGLFQNPSLQFVQRDDKEQKNVYVSPGPDTEKNLKDAIGGQKDQLYLLPEYVTSFVLAKDIKLQFSGLDSKYVSHTLQFMVTASPCVGVMGIFSVCPSVGYGQSKQSVTTDRTANGMIINAPGTQIIGYYTEVLPRSPNKQK